jgi:ABC-type multidrug transport system fused ATPase/permease subunit
MRSNLDPFGNSPSDVELWTALEKIGMASWTHELGGLDVDLAGGKESEEDSIGENCLSVGQRQLICLV